jgi:hypothetical protein
MFLVNRCFCFCFLNQTDCLDAADHIPIGIGVLPFDDKDLFTNATVENGESMVVKSSTDETVHESKFTFTDVPC